MRKILLIAALSFCGYAIAESYQLNKKPHAESKQQSQSPSKPVEEHGSEMGNEFWPPIFGYRVKVTDSLLVLFTFFLWIATRGLVKGADKNAEKQLRAYLTVIIGSATYQETGKDVRFAGIPRLVNNGNTPAHKVSYRIKSAILPVPLPNDFDFPLPKEVVGGAMLGPNQISELQAIVDDFVLDSEVPKIKFGIDRVLYVWGIVKYEDVFGRRRETKFCQSLTWLGSNEGVYGYYNVRHNEAN